MLAKVFSFVLLGIEAYPVEIEVDISPGLPAVTLVGLADTAIRESRERVKSAIKNSGFSWPNERITVSLAPSGLRKEGASFDLAIALGILAANAQLDSQRLRDYFILGELSLEGRIRPIPGVLPITMVAAKTGIRNLIIPAQNSQEATLVSGISVFALKTLRECVEFLHHPQGATPVKIDLEGLFKKQAFYPLDFAEVKGQHLAKRALEVAVAGGHNVLPMGTQYDRQTGRPTD